MTRKVALSLLALSLAGCDDGAGPTETQLVDMLLDFCAGETPSFFAFQNENGAWTRVTPDAFGTFSFRASEKVGLAFVLQEGSSYSSTFVFTTTDEILPLSGVACTEDIGNKTLNGSVSGISAGSAAAISLSGTGAYITAPATDFTLQGVASGPVDLLAHRETFTVSGAVPNRVIVRRGVNLTSGATIQTLDFNGEGAAPTSTTATITGMSSSENNFLDVYFSTTTTAFHLLYGAVFSSGSQPIYGIPASMTQSGDFHTLDVFAAATNGTTYRAFQRYYRNPDNISAALGGVLSTPTISSVATSPIVRLRARLPSQSEYGSIASAFYSQGTQNVSRDVSVTVTAAFVDGTPTTWDLTIPDLSGVSGFPTASGLQSGLETDWSVEAYSGSASLLFGGTPAEGPTLRFAGRASTMQTSQLSRAGRGRPAGRGALVPIIRERIRS